MRAFPARLNEVPKIVIQDTGSDAGGLDAHPLLAHGAHYDDIRSGIGVFDLAKQLSAVEWDESGAEVYEGAVQLWHANGQRHRARGGGRGD